MKSQAKRDQADLSASIRRKIEGRIEAHLNAAEAMLRLLDDADGDPDSEDDGTLEPSLGSINPTFPPPDLAAEWAISGGVTQE